MAGNIKGITIEFRGDTTKLDKALRKVDQETRSIDAELKKVNNNLKFNTSNIELWRQKQDLLKRKIGETEERLKALKDAQAKLDADDAVDKNSAEYQQLRREIIETESKLKTFKGQLKQIGNVSLRAASESFKKLGDNLTKAGQAMKKFSAAGAAVVATLGAMTYKASEAADELNTMSKVYGISTTELQKYAMSAELVDVDVETMVKSQTKLKKSMFSAAQGSKTSAKYFEDLGVNIYDANGNLRDSEDVFNDTIAALGQMENETERDAIAMQLMGKSAQELNPLIADNGETYKAMAEYMEAHGLEFIDEETLAKAGEFNDKIQLIKATGTLAYQTLGAKLAEYLLPALDKVVDLVGRFAEWLTNLDPRVVTIIGAIGGLVAVLAPLLIGLGKVAFAISSIMSLIAVVGPAIAGIGSTLLPVIAIIGAVIAIGVLLYKNWDLIKAAAIQLWTNIKTAFNNIKTSITNTINNVKTFLTNAWNSIKSTAVSKFNAIKEAVLTPIQNMRDKIKSIIETIKGFFHFHVPTPHIKLPHFKISPSGWKLGDLLKGSIPHLDIDWYKTGGIFNTPTIYPIGIGEAGPEAVVPLDKLWSKMDAIAAGSGVTINVNAAPGMDVQALAAEVERRIIDMQNRRRVAWQ